MLSARSYSGPVMAIASAVLFGASIPLAKLLLGGGVNPWLLAGLLYLGSGIGLGILHLVQRVSSGSPAEAPLERRDVPWLGFIVLAGGVVGPLLLMIGLSHTLASAAALLLNIEGLATMGIAWLYSKRMSIVACS